MQLVQIGQPTQVQTVSVREMFERMAKREAEMIQAARAAAQHSKPVRKSRSSRKRH